MADPFQRYGRHISTYSDPTLELTGWTEFICRRFDSQSNINYRVLTDRKGAIDRSLEITVGAGGPDFFGGLSASVKASLQISDETTQEWHEETTEETDETFAANTRYATWSLVDTLTFNKTSVVYEYMGDDDGDPRTPGMSTSTTSNTSKAFNCVIAVYQDHFP